MEKECQSHPTSIRPAFSRRDAGMEMGYHHHLSRVLWMGCWDGGEEPCSPIPCSPRGTAGWRGLPWPPTPLLSFPVLQEGCWGEMGVPHPHVPPSQGRTLGVRQGITSTHPKHSRRMLGWRGGPMSSVPAPSRCDPHTEPGSRTAQAGRWDGDRILHLPWETQPSLGTSLIAGGVHPAFWQLRLL